MPSYRLFYLSVFFLLSTVSFASNLRCLEGLKPHKTQIFSMQNNPWESQTVEQIRDTFSNDKNNLTIVSTTWAHMSNEIIAGEIKNIIIACHDEEYLALSTENLDEIIRSVHENFGEYALRIIINIPEGSTQKYKNLLWEKGSRFLSEVHVGFVERPSEKYYYCSLL